MSALVVTTLGDREGSRVWRSCGKIRVASLLRHLWDGPILVRRNFAEPLFIVERAGLHEEVLPGPGVLRDGKEGSHWDHARI